MLGEGHVIGGVIYTLIWLWAIYGLKQPWELRDLLIQDARERRGLHHDCGV